MITWQDNINKNEDLSQQKLGC